MESVKVVTVLIVEDQRIVAKDLQHRVTQLGYVPAGIVTTGADAIRRVIEVRPDAILMDISLEGPMDGIQVAEQISPLFKTPIIYVTAHSDHATMERANRTHPAGYLVKPFGDEELKRALEHAFTERSGPPRAAATAPSSSPFDPQG